MTTSESILCYNLMADRLFDPEICKKLTVFYHGGCPDGTAGAWAIYRRLHPDFRDIVAELIGENPTVDPLVQLEKNGIVFQGIGHAEPEPNPNLIADRHVVYVDITPSVAIGLQVLQSAASLKILDHHRSALAACETLLLTGVRSLHVVYDEKRSGAAIAWDWAHPGIKRPRVLDYIGDRDIWTFALPHSREVNKYIHTRGCSRSFNALDVAAGCTLSDNGKSLEVLADYGNAAEKIVTFGAAYLEVEQALTERIASFAKLATVTVNTPDGPRDYTVACVNSCCLLSEVGEKIMADAAPEVDFAITWQYVADRNEIWVSARTTRDHIDLSKLTTSVVGAIRGGGHPRAAGFTIPGDSPSAAIRFRTSL